MKNLTLYLWGRGNPPRPAAGGCQYREDILQTNTIDIEIIDETGEKIPIDDYLEEPTQVELK